MEESVDPGLLPFEELPHEGGGNLQVTRGGFHEVGHRLADDHARHHGFGHRIATQPVETMEIPTGRLAAGEQPGEPGGLAAGVGADAAHRVMLGRAHRNQVTRRVDAQEVLADFLHLAQATVDVGLAEQGDIQPQVLAEAALDAVAGADVLLHAAGDHVAGGELFLLGLVIGHEAVTGGVAQQAAVAPAALGDEDARRHDGGRVKLHRLHVAQLGNAGLEGDRRPDALVDDGVRRDPVDPPEAAGGDAGGAGDVGRQLAGDQVAHDGAVAAARVVDQRDGLAALMDGDGFGHRLVAHRVEHGVAGAVGDEAGAPLLGAAKIAGGDQAVGLGPLREADPPAIHHHLPLAGLDAVPGHAPGGQLAHGLGRSVGEQPRHLLVAAPVGAAHGVFKVHVLVVAGAPGGVAEAGLHAALGRRRVGALGRHQAEDDHLVAAAPGAHRRPQPRQPAPDDEDIGVNNAHVQRPRRLIAGAASAPPASAAGTDSGT